MEATYDITKGRKTGEVVKLNAKTALVRIANLTDSRTIKRHLKKHRVELSGAEA